MEVVGTLNHQNMPKRRLRGEVLTTSRNPNDSFIIICYWRVKLRVHNL